MKANDVLLGTGEKEYKIKVPTFESNRRLDHHIDYVNDLHTKVKVNLDELKTKTDELKNEISECRAEQSEIRKSVAELKNDIDELKVLVAKMKSI